MQGHSVLIAQRINRTDGRNKKVSHQPQERDHHDTAHQLAEASAGAPNVEETGDKRDIDQMGRIGKGHPRLSAQGEMIRCNTMLAWNPKSRWSRRYQSLVAVRGGHQQGRVTPERVVHQQNDKKWKPVADDFPKKADKIQEALPCQAAGPCLGAIKYWTNSLASNSVIAGMIMRTSAGLKFPPFTRGKRFGGEG